MKNRLYLLLVPLAAMVLSACSMNRYCPAPQLSMPEQVLRNRTELDSLALADMEWWEVYADTVLRNLIRKTLANNRDMQVAVSKIRQLRYGNRSALAENFPSASLRLGGDYEVTHHYGDNRIKDPEIGLKAVVSWEYNLFGASVWASRQARDNYLASIEGQRALQMSLIAEVATAYFELISLDRQLEIIRSTIEIRWESMEKNRVRFTGGLTSETVYRQAIVEYLNAATLVPDIEKAIALKENEISLLSGEFPSRTERLNVFLEKRQFGEIPVGLPSELLLRRPDVRQERVRLDAAKARAGFYFASRFPSVRLSFDIGFENTAWSNIFQSPYTYFIGNLLVPVLAFGKNHNRYRAALEEYVQQKAAYEQKVLLVFKEVNDAMVTFAKVSESSTMLYNLQKSTQQYVELAELQYLNGVISYLDVLDAHRMHFNAQLNLTRKVCEEYVALVNLYKALGGGWNEEFPKEALTREQQRKQEKMVGKQISDSVQARPGLSPEETLRTVYREFLGKQVTEKTEKLIHGDLNPSGKEKGRYRKSAKNP